MSNSENLRKQADDLEEKVNSLDREDLPTANIVVAGITGSGKSTLINAVFGSDLAKTGTGRPITQNINDYNIPEIPIRIWDTVGFELDSEKTKRAIQDIRQTIADKAKSKNQFDRIHAIWYCIQEGANRYQSSETDFVKSLYELGVPFIIVITKSITDDEYANTICEINRTVGIGKIEVIPVLAQEYKTKLGAIPAFGLGKLVNMTLEKLPEFIRSGFVAAQKVDVALKRIECEKIVVECAKAAKEGFLDKVPLINLFTTDKKVKTMFGKICKIYNATLSDIYLEQVTDNMTVTWKKNMGWLANPFVNKYKNKLEELLKKMSGDGDWNVEKQEFTDWERSALMITYYGYLFVLSIEEVWSEATEEQLKDMDYILHKITRKFNDKFYGK